VIFTRRKKIQSYFFLLAIFTKRIIFSKTKFLLVLFTSKKKFKFVFSLRFEQGEKKANQMDQPITANGV